MRTKSIDLTETILASPSASYWLKAAIRSSAERDVLDALYDAETLLDICIERYNQAIGGSK